jgi:imidazolonepropionase-like amidohydrolase
MEGEMADASVAPWRLPRLVLPDGEERRLWSADGVLTAEEIPGVRTLPGRFAMPGLVDAHAHVALGNDRQLGMDDALTFLEFSRDGGVLLVRDMGSPGRLTLQLPSDRRLPRVVSCGMQLAPRPFFPGMEPVPPGSLRAAAQAEIDRGATWVKILTDWMTPGLLYPIAEIRDVVKLAHAAGVRVAAHSLWADVRDVVDAGVDSIEHGGSMDEATLRGMADRGTVWVPTTNAWVVPSRRARRLLAEGAITPEVRTELEGFLSMAGAVMDNTRPMIPIAVGLGVRVLPSTDREGTVAEEIERFVEFGMDPTAALRAGTVVARQFFGAQGLEPGAPADVVTFDEDPREDPSVLFRPAAILLGGHRIH